MNKTTWTDIIQNTPSLCLKTRPCPLCGSQDSTPVTQGIDFEYRTCNNIFTFVQCKQCALVFLNPSPQRSDLPIIYPAHYYSNSTSKNEETTIVQKIWNIIEQRRCQLFKNLLGEEKRTILDIGCGTGRLLQLLHKYGSQQWRLVGVEFSTTVNTTSSATRITTYQDLYEEHEFVEAPFDLIVGQQIIEHALDPVVLLKKAHRDLQPRGWLILDTPDFDGIDAKLFKHNLWGGYHFPRHLSLFTPRTIRRLADGCGFEVIDIQRLLSPVFWITSLQNTLVDAGVPEKITKHIHPKTLPLLCASTIIEILNSAVLKKNSNMRILLRKI